MKNTPEGRASLIFARDVRVSQGARTVLRYAPALAAGLALRLWMLKEIFYSSGDTLVYGGLARNMLRHGVYAFATVHGVLRPTLIRLPGYPLFLALCFRLFGMENDAAVVYVQIVLELLGCVLLAEFARRVAPPALSRAAALGTLWLAALCPFTASYSIALLTETPTLFALALAMWAMARFRDLPGTSPAGSGLQGGGPGWANALWFTFAVVFAALLRPDGALIAVAFAPALVMGWPAKAVPRRRLARMAVPCILLALLPFVAWTWRNWRVFHVLQPLAPRYANDPDESSYPGWQRWYKTWSLDFASTYQIYWNVPGEPFDVNDLPSRAFDSPAQRAETIALAADYRRDHNDLSPAVDARFARLAQERIRAHPLRYYLWLPLGRLMDMVFRPRVENLPVATRWWAYSRHPFDTCFSWAYAALNVFYLLLGIAGLCLRPRVWAPLLAYVVLRCALLLTIGAPETRYTLEFFPILFVWGGIAAAAAVGKLRAAVTRR